MTIRRFAAVLLATTTLCSNTQAATFKYTGNRLTALEKGLGVPGATKLKWVMNGPKPNLGSCQNEQIISISDGANTLAGLLAQGWVVNNSETLFQVCSDANSGALTFEMVADLVLYQNGNYVEDILWDSQFPSGPAPIDSAQYSFANFSVQRSVSYTLGNLRVIGK